MEPEWLTAEHLERLNQRIVEDSGEPFGILKRHQLLSAPMRPRQMFYYDQVEDIAALAVRLMMAVVWAHPFEQGNKRTGFAAAEIFLEANGWLLDIPDYDDIAEQVIEAASDDSLEGELVELFRQSLIEMT